MNLLFVCSENRMRSPTGEALFSAYEGINARSAGTQADAETTVSEALIEWADIIFVMETYHRIQIVQKFKALLKGKPVVCLDIPDRYCRMDPELIRLLESKVTQYIRSS